MYLHVRPCVCLCAARCTCSYVLCACMRASLSRVYSLYMPVHESIGVARGR